MSPIAAPAGVPAWLAHPTVIPASTKIPLHSDKIPLSTDLRTRCATTDGIVDFFAVQAAVLPLLIHTARNVTTRHRLPDLCVSAPTGSGKTLAYVLPVVEKLRHRIVPRLRALVVVPTPDLVQQVYATFVQYCEGGTDLKVAAFDSQATFADEEAAVRGRAETSADATHDDFPTPPVRRGGVSAVDILVTTPGRLTEHLAATRDFTLQHLEFLIIDEADHVLNQDYQGWLEKIRAATEQSAATTASFTGTQLPTCDGLGLPHHDAQATGARGIADPYIFCRPAPRLQKLIFSATLPSDPGHLALLNLVNPQHIAVRGTAETAPEAEADRAAVDQNPETTAEAADTKKRKQGPPPVDFTVHFTAPPSLQEFSVLTTDQNRPLAVYHLITAPRCRSALCFTSSVEAAHRLYQLLTLFAKKYYERMHDNKHRKLVKKPNPKDPAAAAPASPLPPSDATHLPTLPVIVDFSSDLDPAQRSDILQRFKRGEIQLLVCSDMFSRGLDVDCVDTVINYDLPAQAQGYIHRVGRTARAGREGHAYTLMAAREMTKFRNLMRAADHLDQVSRYKLPSNAMRRFEKPYGMAVRQLGIIYK
ncbi:ATP-dependent RNA helicase dbp6 [Tieghemiomyces parasiticus]|uniref:ATP-dependent RNA helicase n=1 Tax=Tieghemiomyces parasiticus TaxID=78921 RepID=A0A9W8DTV4_9FUNG|nr:ATP-dependent RNA helicase dbp6 [Tieghemiomyces parasiticus]